MIQKVRYVFYIAVRFYFIRLCCYHLLMKVCDWKMENRLGESGVVVGGSYGYIPVFHKREMRLVFLVTSLWRLEDINLFSHDY